MNERKSYLLNSVPLLFKQLSGDKEPAFGIMTAHHMVEHLIWVTKSSVKDYGPPPSALSDKQLGFMRFIQNGAQFKHRPSDKKREDMAPPRTADISTAIAGIPEAIQRLYAHEQTHIFFNPMMGRLTFDEMELMHAHHFKYHLEEQFGLSLPDAL